MDDWGWELENFRNAYRNWLGSIVRDVDHVILFDVLYDTEYVWWLERDGDRARDGIYLRARFEHDSGLPCPEGWDDWPCSFLEFVVGLAFTMDEMLMYSPDVNGIPRWFWLMMENCGLAEFDDRTMLEGGKAASDAVAALVRGILDREYDYDGSGGLFPLHHPEEDQRNVEYWVQMNAFVMETGMV